MTSPANKNRKGNAKLKADVDAARRTAPSGRSKAAGNARRSPWGAKLEAARRRAEEKDDPPGGSGR
ncbi:MAG: hypothetical protein ACPGQL_03340 [Thermoplasmatota archaeon]